VSNSDDDITSSGGTVTCQNASWTTGVANCGGGCSGSYVIPPTCILCSPTSPPLECTTCPQGTYGGPTAELSCELCPSQYTTIYPPPAMDVSQCVPITEPPSVAPSINPTLPPTALGATAFPTVTPTTAPPSQASAACCGRTPSDNKTNSGTEVSHNAHPALTG
jgi:hypothetical protein